MAVFNGDPRTNQRRTCNLLHTPPAVLIISLLIISSTGYKLTILDHTLIIISLLIISSTGYKLTILGCDLAHTTCLQHKRLLFVVDTNFKLKFVFPDAETKAR